jgi:hypothetical protein
MDRQAQHAWANPPPPHTTSSSASSSGSSPASSSRQVSARLIQLATPKSHDHSYDKSQSYQSLEPVRPPVRPRSAPVNDDADVAVRRSSSGTSGTSGTSGRGTRGTGGATSKTRPLLRPRPPLWEKKSHQTLPPPSPPSPVLPPIDGLASDGVSGSTGRSGSMGSRANTGKTGSRSKGRKGTGVLIGVGNLSARLTQLATPKPSSEIQVRNDDVYSYAFLNS